MSARLFLLDTDISIYLLNGRLPAAAAYNEIIPYETVFVGDPGLPVSEEEVELCRQLQGEAG